LPVSNCYVQPAQSADVISAEPRTVSPHVAWLTAVALLAAALTGAVAVAVHYRDEAAAARRQLRSAHASAPPSVASPTLSSSTAALPSSGPLAGEVTAFAVRSSAGRAQIVVTARITGGRPHSRYALFGADCTSNAAAHYWAAGVTDAHGSANLSGHVWTVSVSHEYYIVLGAPGMYQTRPGPAVHGYFGIAHGLSPVPGRIAPCAP
jgi:hypothetical protein